MAQLTEAAVDTVRRPPQFSLFALLVITVLLGGLALCGVTIWQQREEKRALQKLHEIRQAELQKQIEDQETEMAMLRYSIQKYQTLK